MVAQAFTAFQRAALTNLWSDDHGSPSSARPEQSLDSSLRFIWCQSS